MKDKFNIEFNNTYRVVSNFILSSDSTYNTNEYIDQVKEAIDKTISDINSFRNNSKPADFLKGDIAEYWHADTFNIDAIKNRSNHRAIVPRSNNLASVDVKTNFNKDYSLKYYNTSKSSALEQAKSILDKYKEYVGKGGKDDLKTYLIKNEYNDIDINNPIYLNQYRLIPTEQIESAIKILKYRLETNKINNPQQVKKFKDTLDLLTDLVKDDDGNKSQPLTNKKAKRIAEILKKRDITDEDLELCVDEIIKDKDIIRESIKSGLTTAIISMLLKLAPCILSIIQKELENNNITDEVINKIGSDALEGFVDGSLYGTISATMTLLFKSGKFGPAIKQASPHLIAILTVFSIDIIKMSIDVSVGRLSKQEFVNNLSDEMFMVIFGHVTGVATQGLMPTIPFIPYFVGNFIGTVIGSFAHKFSSEIIMSLCIETGITLFCLVEQDYKLPKEILDKMCIEEFEYDNFEYSKFELSKNQFSTFNYHIFTPSSFELRILKRGVIGINRIGYFR